MTIKHIGKNISAENVPVITNVQETPYGKLTFTLTNFYTNNTTSIDVDLSQHKLKLVKVTAQQLATIKASNDTDVQNARESCIYLVEDDAHQGSDIYQEFLWVDNDFEIIGSTRINLSDYFLKSDIYNGLDYLTNDSAKALSAYQGSVLNTAIGGKAPTNHASQSDTYGKATVSNYGHAKASNTNPSDISLSAANKGTDNGEYARGDHTHKLDGVSEYDITITYDDDSTEPLTLLVKDQPSL